MPAVKIRSGTPSPLTSPVAAWISPEKPGKGTTKVRTEPTIFSGGWVAPRPRGVRGGGGGGGAHAVGCVGCGGGGSARPGVTVAVLVTVPEVAATVPLAV